MDSFKEDLVGMLPALWVVIPIIVLFVLFKALRSSGREQKKNTNKIDHAVQWPELCRRIAEAAAEHLSGRLETVISNEEGSYGGQVVVVWQSLGEKLDEVLRVTYPSQQPVDRIEITTFSLKGRKGTFYLSRGEFSYFLRSFERTILDYETPFSRKEGDKPKL